jgi:hypothetical protein
MGVLAAALGGLQGRAVYGLAPCESPIHSSQLTRHENGLLRGITRSQAIKQMRHATGPSTTLRVHVTVHSANGFNHASPERLLEMLWQMHADRTDAGADLEGFQPDILVLLPDEVIQQDDLSWQGRACLLENLIL